jgi:hypothetical protein
MTKNKISKLLGVMLISISAVNLCAEETAFASERSHDSKQGSIQSANQGTEQSELITSENGYVSKATFDGIIAFQNQVDLAVFALNNQPEVLTSYVKYIDTHAENYVAPEVFILERDAKLYATIQQNFEQSENQTLSLSDYFMQEILLNQFNSLYEAKVDLPRDRHFKQMVMTDHPELFENYQDAIPIKKITDFFAEYMPENQQELDSALFSGSTGTSTGGTGGWGPRGTCGCSTVFTVQSDPTTLEQTHNRYNRHAGAPNQSFREQWVDKSPLYQRNQWNAKSWSNPQEVDNNTSLVSTSSQISVALLCNNDCGMNDGCVADVNYIGSLGSRLAVDTNVTGIFGSGISESLSTSNSTFEVRTQTGNHRTTLFDKELTLMKSHSKTFNMKGITDFIAAVGNAAKTIKIDQNGNTNDQANLSEVVNELITTGKTIMTNEESGQAGASQHMKVEVDSTTLNGFSSNHLRNGEMMIFETKTNNHIKLKEADGASYWTSNTTGGALGVAISRFQCTSGVIAKPVDKGCWLKGAGFETPYSLATLDQKVDGFIGRSLGVSGFDSTQYSNGCYQ